MAKVFARIEGTDFLYATAHLGDSAFRGLLKLMAWCAQWRAGASMHVSIARTLLGGNRRKQDRIIGELTDSTGKEPCLLIDGIGDKATLTISDKIVRWGRIGGPDRKTMTKVLARDGNRCRYCLRETTPATRALDHVVPLSRGGSDLSSNLVVCCRSCNSAKHASTPSEKGMVLN